MTNQHSDKAALRGEPSYVWRAGQERRLKMVCSAVGERVYGKVFENGVGLGAYLARFARDARQAVGLDVEHERTVAAHQRVEQVVCGVGEYLPFPSDYFDLIFSNEVLEHVKDDYQVMREMVRTLKPGGQIAIFCPNRGYPFETHGIYWRGKYHFGNIPLVNYFPRSLRDRLAPHVQVYTRRDLQKRLHGLPVKVLRRSTVFGAYDNIIARSARWGNSLRAILQFLERTPLQVFGLSHFWVIEKIQS
jgi:SAM-dependent methyltransferase